MIRLVAVEDDARYRSSLETLFRHTPDFTLLRAFAAPEPALAHLRKKVDAGEPGVDLVLMDLDLPGMGGVECTRQLRALLTDTRVVVLTVFDDRASVLEAICAGASGYLLKHSSVDRLLTDLRAVLDGGAPLSPSVARLLLDVVRQHPVPAGPRHRGSLELTEREQDVLRCLVEGMSYKRAARALDISVDTVRTHIRSVYGKLQVHSVAEAVSRAIRERIV